MRKSQEMAIACKIKRIVEDGTRCTEPNSTQHVKCICCGLY
jgi:hypothetical protein